MDFIKSFLKRLSIAFHVFITLPTDFKKQRKYFKLFRYTMKKNPATFLKHCDEIINILDENKDNVELSIYKEIPNHFLKRKIDKNYKNTTCPKILIISHEFSLTGAPKAALMLAKAIKDIYQTSPIVLSLKNGPIKDEFIKSGICVIDYQTLPVIKENFINFFNQFDIVIKNSYGYNFFDKLSMIKPPIIWWSHEIFKSKAEIEIVKKFCPKCHSIWYGSMLTKTNIENIYKHKNTNILLYGLEKTTIPMKTDANINFSVIGTFDKRKGQDIFLKAIRMLDKETRIKANFYFIGGNKSASFLKNETENETENENINFVDKVPFKKLLEYYKNSDVIVTPSRDDPMPIVSTYAFMFKRLCVVSDMTGTALLIDNYKNGIVFENENYKQLSKIIADIINNKSKYNEIAENGYKVYEKNFSMAVFKNNIKTNIEKIINEK